MFFYFRELEKEEIQREIHNLNNNKASQHYDISTKINKYKYFNKIFLVYIMP